MSTTESAAQATFEERYRAAVRDLETAARVLAESEARRENLSTVMLRQDSAIAMLRAENEFRIAEACEQRDEARAELAAEVEMQATLQAQLAGEVERHLATMRERDAAREEQREACAAMFADPNPCSCDQLDMDATCESCQGKGVAEALRAMPLATTPLADRIAELEAELSISQTEGETEERCRMSAESERDALKAKLALANERQTFLDGAADIANLQGERDALKARVVELESDLRAEVVTRDEMASVADQSHQRAEAAEARVKELEQAEECGVDGRPTCHPKPGTTEADWCHMCCVAEYRHLRKERDEARALAESRRVALDAVSDDLEVIGTSAHPDAVTACIEHAKMVAAEALVGRAALPAPLPEPKEFPHPSESPDFGAGPYADALPAAEPKPEQIRLREMVETSQAVEHADRMAVAERVRDACIEVFAEMGLNWPAAEMRALDLAALLAEVKR